VKNGIKYGFGLAIGYFLGMTCIRAAGESIMKKLANDKNYMDDLKNRDPDFYEKLKKYTTQD
jgi:hypothetical protein